jgi:hypothetical protein
LPVLLALGHRYRRDFLPIYEILRASDEEPAMTGGG